MAAADFPIYFTVTANSSQAVASFQVLNGEMDKVAIKTAEVSKATKTSQASFAGLGKVIFGLGAAFAYIGYQGVKQLTSVEDAQANLSTAIKNTGVSWSTAKPYVDSAAASMRNLGFTTQDTYGALSTLTAASRNPKVALETLAVTADLARFKTISLTQAGTLLSRATTGQARGLGDLGIAIGKTIPKGADLKTILQAIEDRAGGAALAFKKTLSGGIQVAQANFKEFETQVGVQLVPTLEKISTWISTKGIKDLQDLFGVIKTHTGDIKDFAEIFGSIWAVTKITAGVTATVNGIKEITKAYEALRLVLVTTGIAEAFATAGISVGTATVAIAGAVAAGYLITQTPKVIKEFTGGGTKPDYSQQYRPGVGAYFGNIDSGKKPASFAKTSSTAAKKPSITKQKKGTTSLGTGVNVQVFVDGSAAVAKTMVSGAPLKKGGK